MGQLIRKVSAKGRFVGWYVRWVDADGKRRARATKATSAAEARRILVELEAQAGRRKLGIPDRPQPIKGIDLIERWLEEYQPRTRDRRRWVIKQKYNLASALPHITGIVSRADAARIVRKLSDGKKSNTVRACVGTLKSAWKWAVSVGISDGNPWDMRLPPPERKNDYLSREEVARLLAAVDADTQPHREVMAVAVRLAIYAGLRVCEVYGLRWRSVDFDRNVIVIRHGFRDSPTKSRRERVIPIADQLREHLESWHKRCPSQDYVCPTFSSTTRKWFAARVRPDIRRFYRSAGLSVPSSPWHVLRHTFASHFLMSGGGLLTLQRILGHTSLTHTQIYSHLSDEHVAIEMKRLRL